MNDDLVERARDELRAIERDRKGGGLVLVDPRLIKLEAVRWFLVDRIPFGELTMEDGDGGIGKTTLNLDLAARYAAGADLPDGRCHAPGKVLVLAEEDRDSILRARLQVAQADFDRVRFIKGVGAKADRFALPAHVAALREAIEGFGATLVVIDALFNHLEDGLSQNKSQDVRKVLTPLATVAHETGAAILATRHYGKMPNGAGNRGLGSVDIKNVCRSVLAVGLHPDDETQRVIAVAKTNLGMPCDALTYRLESVDVAADDGTTFAVARVVWTGTAAIKADSLTLSQPQNDDERSALEDACDRIREALSGGEKIAADFQASVLRSQVSPTTFRRARKKLHDAGEIVRSGGGGFGGPVVWRLASHRISSSPIESHSSERDSMTRDEILWDNRTPGGKLCRNCKTLARAFDCGDGTFICQLCAEVQHDRND